jgi:AcrR family transcriptional regulator
MLAPYQVIGYSPYQAIGYQAIGSGLNTVTLSPPTNPFTERHQEVLEAAMALIAERGFAGASLRELARRVSVSQPSLYHYFDNKEALVEQVTEWYSGQVMGQHMAAVQGHPDALLELRGMLRFAMGRIAETWSTPRHVTFVRFLFAVTMERPEMGPRFRQLFLDRGYTMCRMMLEPFVTQGSINPEDLEPALNTCIHALVMDFMQERILHMPTNRQTSITEYIDFMVDMVVRGLESRAAAVVADQTQGDN